MTKVLLLLSAVVFTFPAYAEEPWILQEGPLAVESIPLVPLQPVPSWRGHYSDGDVSVWLYVTKSPHFFPPTSPEVRLLVGTAWTVAAFFPAEWKSAQRSAWFDLWVREFRVLDSLPAPGWPILFPSVLRKG